MGIKFSQSPKIREPLNMLEMNDIHLLNWGSPRMAGFLDACMQASNIIILFLDTVISGSILPDQIKFLTSAKSKAFNSFVDFIFPDEFLK